MTGNFITRCPKCSTAFRVTDDVLKMAAGKVRCGQCFHIFEAQETPVQKPKNPSKKVNGDPTPSNAESETDLQSQLSNTSEQQYTGTPPVKPVNENSPPLFTAADEEIVNPNWLNTLFKEDDLELVSEPPKDTFTLNANDTDQLKERSPVPRSNTSSAENPAPWEIELAEIEANISHAPTPNTERKSKTINQHQEPTRQKHREVNGTKEANPNQLVEEHTHNDEPDYMQALHSLAQNVSDQAPKLSNAQHEFQESMNTLAATNSLAHLVEEESAPERKSKHTTLWSLGFFIGLLVLASQVLIHFFDLGSRSEQFRGLYRTACTYTGCALPAFENIESITIQHVRIQSHPQRSNALLVNAIMTNTSSYAQPMPKIALEFYDLNSSPVAARLFSPENYLHKDFLDITYMPPNTPIHLVIPIVDPGARAVTHELKVYSAETRSY
ncbi:DUF3426 domain-containing protein [Marinomonas balearica]|uniref:Putative Zn finger-like uncharacterized protein n=1 Tax=Marinomonas balearica TaxID=491947 RepID=A0A4R6MAY9_9GAMM|nr:DUF3426 domain-containing protein [Marinomonas balearica]TDO98731.1 putative Zn finger-like uncharacterized protein [Marinomonas balearica]